SSVGPDVDAGVVAAYKNLANLERDFRHLKVDDLDLRPIHHRPEDRVRAHVLVCFLAGYLVCHLRATLAPLTFTDEVPPPAAGPGRTRLSVGGRERQGRPQDRPARRAGPRLSRAARPPRHAHPQPDPDRRENGVRPAGQPYPDATPSLRAARGTYPTDEAIPSQALSPIAAPYSVRGQH
ncbi:MAG TPA: hypothetical protein VF317_08665, partial [Dermatophilaceae bacterium]